MESKGFIYPQVGIVTNDNQIKHLQHKLLINSYQQNAIHKKLKGSVYIPLKQQHNTVNPQDHNRYNYQNQVRVIRSKQVKKTWANQLDQQIKNKQMKQKQQKINNIQQQNRYIRSNKVLQDIEKIRQIQFLKETQKEAQQSYQQKQLKKLEERRNELQQKEYFRQRYSLNNLALQVQYNSPNKGDSDATKKYYEQILQQRRKTSFLENPSYNLNANDDFKKIQIKRMSNLSPIQLRKIQQDYFEKQKQNQHQIQLSLKETLLQQIRNSQVKKKQEKQKAFNTPFINPQYKSIYHTIYNPVDIRVGKDNPYVLKQLTDGITQKNTASQKSQVGSYLSRKGSQSLLK